MTPRLLLIASLLLSSMATVAVADCASERQACRRATSELAQCGVRTDCDRLAETAERVCLNAEIACRAERMERSQRGSPPRH